MNISGFIQRTKAKATNMVEARKNAVASRRQEQTENLRIKNAVLREEAKERNDLESAKQEHKRLKQEAFKSRLGAFGNIGNTNNSPTKSRSNNRATSGFGNPFGASNSFGGNSPFSSKNLQNDSFGKSSPFATGGIFGGSSEKKVRSKKKKTSKTIVIKV